MLDSARENPINQTLEYLDRFRSGGVRTAHGRPIPSSPNIPGFCYVLSDLTPNLEKCCRLAGPKKTVDGPGYFGYNEPYDAFIEVLSFDRPLKNACERNRAFFDKLGRPVQR